MKGTSRHANALRLGPLGLESTIIKSAIHGLRLLESRRCLWVVISISSILVLVISHPRYSVYAIVKVGDSHSRPYQAPQKAITAIAPLSSEGTFLAGCADGRILSYSLASGESSVLNGGGHSSLVTSIASSSSDGKIYSAGFDDHVREISGHQFTSVTSILFALWVSDHPYTELLRWRLLLSRNRLP